MAERPSSSHRSTTQGTNPSRSHARSGAPSSGEASGEKGASRTVLLVGFFLVFALLLIIRLVYLQVVAAPQYAQDAVDSRTVKIELEARRGTIYDRNGNVLACSVDATTIYAVPTEIEDPKSTAIVLASALDKKAEDLEPLLSDKTSTFCYVARKQTTEVGDKVRDLDLDGIYFLDDSRREYPYGSAGGTVIGFVNFDGEGVSGLEAQYDDILKGVNGVKRMEIGVNQVLIQNSNLESTAAVDGQDIMISIDIEMQAKLEETCAFWAKNVKAEAESMLYDGGTGEIIAACSTPLLDPTNISEIKEGATELSVINAAYEPGSIFKTVSAISALEDKVMGIDDEIACPAYIEADGYQISDAHPRGDVDYTFKEVIKYSSNVGISLITEKTGFDKLFNRIHEYGLNDLTKVDYPGEAEGYLLDFDYWSKVQAYNVSFGQGITVTPVQMCRMYGAIVNNGVACTPHFLIAYPQTGEHPTYDSVEIIHNKDTIPAITTMLESVVAGGTGMNAQIGGYTPAGKTGTAEIADGEGGYMKYTYNISFTGFLANTDSKLVCFTGVRAWPGEGDSSAMFAEIMSFAIERYKIIQKE